MWRLVTLLISVLLMCRIQASAGRVITVHNQNDYSAPFVGNGNIGFSVGVDGLAVQNLFSHATFAEPSPERVATIIPSLLPISLSINGDNLAGAESWRQTLDMDNGCITTFGRLNGIEADATFRALRNFPGIVMASVTVKALRNMDVTVVNSPSIPENFSCPNIEKRTIWCEDGGFKTLRLSGSYNSGRDKVVSSSVYLFSKPWTLVSPDTITANLRKGEEASFSLIASICSTSETRDPWSEAERIIIFASRFGAASLISEHNEAWRTLWKGNIDIVGDDRLQQIADVALYSLYSSIREGSSKSIAPMGLTSDKYFGHVFWDADMWIYPPLAVLNPELASGIIDFRYATLSAAKAKARTYGYRGAMYPWEADNCGEESTPTFALTGPFEHHVTAVVGLAAAEHFALTSDTTWLREKGFPVIKECCDFWVSRVRKNCDGTYSIPNVVGADEYAINVTDNAFTNAAVSKMLRNASTLASVAGYRAEKAWTSISDSLRIVRNKDGIVMEYEGYDGAAIKQADVALLAYPLGYISDSKDVDRNIDFYDSKLDAKNGPAMSHSVMAVNYARSGNPERAYRLLLKGIAPYLVGPFFSIAETPSNGATYFMTGAGGVLQGLIFGFAGIEISDEGLRQVDSALPEHIKSITVNLADGRSFVRR